MAIQTDHRAYKLLQNQIVSYHYEPKTSLSIPELASKVNFGTTPVREALIRLANDDFIDWIPGKGFYVKRPSAPYFAEQFKLLRILLGGALSDLAGGKPETRVSTVRRLELATNKLALESRPLHFALGVRDVYTELLTASMDQSIVRLFGVAMAKTHAVWTLEFDGARRELNDLSKLLDAILAGRKTEVHRRISTIFDRRNNALPCAVEQLIIQLHQRFGDRRRSNDDASIEQGML